MIHGSRSKRVWERYWTAGFDARSVHACDSPPVRELPADVLPDDGGDLAKRERPRMRALGQLFEGAG